MTSATITPLTNQQTTTRLLSLDVLRGLTIAFMILVNNNGDEAHAYWALKHTAWNGFTPTDLVFPTFLFLIGIAITFSTAARLAKGATRQSLFLHTIRRTVILFLLGLLVNSYPHFNLHTLRIYGVLPRLAICYFIAANLYLITPAWRNKVVIAIAALLGYWILMRFVAVPGYGVPTHNVPLLDPNGNLTAWLDRQVFSPSHLYEHTRDPEGLLSTLPAIATALIGLLTGEWLRTTRTLAQKARGIAIAGITSLLLGALWNPWFPINKKLWTSSYVLYAAGWSLLLLAITIWLTDIRNAKATTSPQKKTFTPLLVFGTNAIAAYVFSELLQSTLTSIHPNPLNPKFNLQIRLFQLIHNIIPNAPFASLLYSIAFAIVCWLAIYPLYRRKIFIKI
jgi:predicted acyltransferase